LAQSPVVAWIQLGPGSKSANPTTANFGDAPLSATPTVLARAVFSDLSAGCPSMTLDGAASIQMSQRFIGRELTSVPGTPLSVGKAQNSPGVTSGYPQFFVDPSVDASASPAPTFPDGTLRATTKWGECEAIVPPGHNTATIGGVALKLPAAHPKRILVIGDTGCRMAGAYKPATNSNEQNCHDPAKFPLAYLASVEATFQPDLIVHVGDYFYRDTGCNSFYRDTGCNSFAGAPGCGDPTNANYETWGDTFDSWNADLLFPAKPLLQAAPWVMIRGNHESCGRGARGWFALLDPHPYSFRNVACQKTAKYPAPSTNPMAAIYNGDFTPSYLVPVNNIDLIAFDSSFANDFAVDANAAANYDIDLTNAVAAIGNGATAIYVTHKPTFGLVSGAVTGGNTSTAGNATEQAVFNGGTYAASAFRNGVPESIGLFLSGHIHQMQYLDLSDYRKFAPQLIVGVGGDLLDPNLANGVAPDGDTDLPGYVLGPDPQQQVHAAGGAVATQPLTHAYTHDEFGFAVLDAVDDRDGNTTGYTANVYEISASHSGVCTIELKGHRNITCTF
jgi:hypothetical protein